MWGRPMPSAEETNLDRLVYANVLLLWQRAKRPLPAVRP